MTTAAYGETPVWGPGRPHIRPLRLLVSWVLSTLSLLGACWIVPGAAVKGFWGALAAAAVIAMLNAVLPPLIAALRLPLMLVVGLLLILIVDALMLLAADRVTDGIARDRLVLVGARRRSRGVGRLGRARRASSARTTTTPTRFA